MFVCTYTDDDGLEFFASGESMEEAFENLDHDNALDIAPDDGSVEFFEKIAVQYITRPRFERV